MKMPRTKTPLRLRSTVTLKLQLSRSNIAIPEVARFAGILHTRLPKFSMERFASSWTIPRLHRTVDCLKHRGGKMCSFLDLSCCGVDCLGTWAPRAGISQREKKK